MGKGLLIVWKGLMKIYGFRCFLQTLTFNVSLLMSILSWYIDSPFHQDNLFNLHDFEQTELYGNVLIGSLIDRVRDTVDCA